MTEEPDHDLTGKSYLITGAAGFIGSHLARKLVHDGAQVHALVRRGSDLWRLSDIADRVVIHFADLNNQTAVYSCVKAAQPDCVFHLAAETRPDSSVTPRSVQEATRNVLEPLGNLLSALSELQNPPSSFVRAGTIAEYGNSPLPYTEANREAPVTQYGMAMLAGTHYLAMLSSRLPFPVITARIALTFGPGQSLRFLVPATLDACLSEQHIHIRRPHDKRDLLYIDDLIEALLLVGSGTAEGYDIINLATGQAPMMADVALTVAGLVEADPTLVSLEPVHASNLPNVLLCDTRRARDVLGWQAKISWQGGLERMIAHERTFSGYRRSDYG
ncbi:MAG: NAD-dependent epimerase/dehydratase family protein [Sphingomonadaceae bacterium]